MPEIDYGLKLPFRWYDDIEKQMRYRGCGRYMADDIQHDEYLISLGCRLLPFQIKRDKSPYGVSDLTIKIIRVDNDVETDLSTEIISNGDIDIFNVGSYDYITYYSLYDIESDGNCLFDNCLYYGYLHDGENQWWSELFNSYNTGYEETYYRLWKDGHDRISASGDKRIWK